MRSRVGSMDETDEHNHEGIRGRTRFTHARDLWLRLWMGLMLVTEQQSTRCIVPRLRSASSNQGRSPYRNRAKIILGRTAKILSSPWMFSQFGLPPRRAQKTRCCCQHGKDKGMLWVFLHRWIVRRQEQKQHCSAR